jgi:hypothetical protein
MLSSLTTVNGDVDPVDPVDDVLRPIRSGSFGNDKLVAIAAEVVNAGTDWVLVNVNGDAEAEAALILLDGRTLANCANVNDATSPDDGVNEIKPFPITPPADDDGDEDANKCR